MNLTSLRFLGRRSAALLPEVEVDLPKCIVFTNFLDLDQTAGVNHLTKLYCARRHTAPAVELYTLPRDTLVAVPTQEEFLPTWDLNVLAEQVRPSWRDVDVQNAIDMCKEIIELAGEAVLIGRYGIRTWGHWLGELLPKLVCVEAIFPGRFTYVLPESVFTDTLLFSLRESLSAYGIHRHRLHLVRPGCLYRFSALHAVSSVWSTDNVIHPQAVNLMRAIVPQDTELLGAPQRIAMLRRESTTRNIANLDQLVLLLEDNGFTIIDIGNFSFRDQVGIFAKARHIVAVLGSGLTGLMYSPTGIDVLTLAPSNWSDRFFFALMQDRKARLVDIRGRSQALDSIGAAREQFSVEIDAVSAGLQAFNLPAATSVVSAGDDNASYNEGGLTNTPSFLLATAQRLQKAGQFDEAERVILAAIDLSPSDPMPYRLMAETLLVAGRLLDAVSAVLRARDLAPEDLQTLHLLGKVYVNSGQIDAGIEAYQNALSADPDNVRVLWTLTKLVETHGPPDLALGFIDRVIALEPANYAAHSQRGHLLARLGMLEEAASAFKKALSGEPENAGLYESLAHTLGGLRLFSEAVQAARAAVAAAPASARMHILLARMLRQNGRSNEAIRVGRDAEALEPSKATLKPEFDRVMDLTPGNAPTINCLRQRQQTGKPLVLVDVKAETCRVSDSLMLVPWLLFLADRHGSVVQISGQFSAAVHPLLIGLPLQFGELHQERPLITYTADVPMCRDYARLRGLHMCQGYFELGAMPSPALPMAVEFHEEAIDLIPGIVINPFTMSEEPSKADDGATRCADLWPTLIRAIQTSGRYNPIYVIGCAADDPTPYLGFGVVPLLGRPLSELFSVLRQAPWFISIDTHLADVAHLGGISRHLLVYPTDDVPDLVSNPRASVIRSPSDSVDTIISKMNALPSEELSANTIS